MAIQWVSSQDLNSAAHTVKIMKELMHYPGSKERCYVIFSTTVLIADISISLSLSLSLSFSASLTYSCMISKICHYEVTAAALPFSSNMPSLGLRQH